MFTKDVKRYIEHSVLCWLATSNKKAEPNVSPKEIFLRYDDTKILIANIASPKTIRNIKENPQVCISFINVFVQKGYKTSRSRKNAIKRKLASNYFYYH